MFKVNDLVFDCRIKVKGIISEIESSTGNIWVVFSEGENPLKVMYNRFGFLYQTGFDSLAYKSNSGIRKEQITRKVSEGVYETDYIYDPRLSVLAN